MYTVNIKNYNAGEGIFTDEFITNTNPMEMPIPINQDAKFLTLELLNDVKVYIPFEQILEIEVIEN